MTATLATSLASSRAQWRPRGATAGIAYMLWLRSRWALTGMIGAIVAGAAVVRLFPGLPHGSVSISLMMIFTMGLILLAGVFTFNGKNLGAKESMFPVNMMILPASNRRLVGAPMAIAALTSSTLWILLVTLVMWPAGDRVPLRWTVPAVGGIVIWLQAMAWLPFWFGVLRVLATVGVLLGVIGGGLFGAISHEFYLPEWPIFFGYVAILLLAYPLATAGVAKARRGDGGFPLSFARAFKSRGGAVRVKLAFTSPAAAQLWLELRRNCVLALVFATLAPLILAVVGLLMPTKPIYLPSMTIYPTLLLAAAALASPFITTGMHGGSMGKSDIWSKELAISPFIAIRPVGTNFLVLAKFAAAAIVTVASFIIALFVVFLWSLFPNSYEPGQSIFGLVVSHAKPGLVLAAIGVLIVSGFMTCKGMAQAMFISMYGRLWLGVVFGIAITVLGLVGTLVGWRAYVDPHVRDVVKIAAPWLLFSVAAFKVAAALRTLATLRRMKLMRPITITAILAAGAAIVVVAAVITLIVSGGRVGWAGTAACSAILLIPIVRLALAPATLHCNRHRK